MLKGREIEEKFRSMGHERATIHCVRELAEAQMALNNSQVELAEAFTTLAGAVMTLAGGTVDLRKQVEKIKGHAVHEAEFDGDKK